MSLVECSASGCPALTTSISGLCVEHDPDVNLGHIIKVRIAPHGSAAYVSEKPSADGVHVGEWKHSEEPVRVRWTGMEWVDDDA